MKTKLVFLLALAGCSLNGLAQTNSHAPPVETLKLDSSETVFPIRLQESPVRLRLAEEAQPRLDQIAPVLSTNPPPAGPVPGLSGEVAFGSTLLTPSEQRIYQMLDEGGYLSPEEKVESPIERAIQAVFEPEVFRTGKARVSCSVATAVKRKNPLCLLSPLFFEMSW